MRRVLGEGDWLADHSEDGQTFDQYKGAKWNRVDEKRKVLYIMPLQEMSKEFLEGCHRFCAAFYHGMDVKLNLKAGLSSMKVESRTNEYSKKIQYKASSILVHAKK